MKPAGNAGRQEAGVSGLMLWMDRVRAWNRRRLIRRGVTQLQPRDSALGFRFVGPDVMVEGRFEPVETQFLIAELAKCTGFVNIGANFGYYCCLAQKMGVKTLAFEPVPSNYQVLLRNVQANGWSSITVLPVAVGDKPGVTQIYGEGTGASLVAHWARNPLTLAHTVPVVALDDVVVPAALGEKPLLLMDVEGYEYFVLLGGKALLANEKLDATWMVEIELKQHRKEENPHFLDTFKLFSENGFKIFSIQDLNTEITLEAVQAWVTNSAYDQACGNFVFRRR